MEHKSLLGIIDNIAHRTSDQKSAIRTRVNWEWAVDNVNKLGKWVVRRFRNGAVGRYRKYYIGMGEPEIRSNWEGYHHRGTRGHSHKWGMCSGHDNR